MPESIPCRVAFPVVPLSVNCSGIVKVNLIPQDVQRIGNSRRVGSYKHVNVVGDWLGCQIDENLVKRDVIIFQHHERQRDFDLVTDTRATSTLKGGTVGTDANQNRVKLARVVNKLATFRVKSIPCSV